MFLHGGDFEYESGQGAFDSYGGGFIAARGAVVVTLNYRLGVLGWLAATGLSTGANAGLLDQRLALGWVQANAAAFGGDPGRVTLWGQSAGAISASAHLASPASAGLFARAVLESASPGVPLWGGAAQLAPYGDAVASVLGCRVAGPAAAVAACLRAAPLADLLASSAAVVAGTGALLLWGPVVGEAGVAGQPVALAAHGGLLRGVDLLFGTTTDEQARRVESRSHALAHVRTHALRRVLVKLRHPHLQ